MSTKAHDMALAVAANADQLRAEIRDNPDPFVDTIGLIAERRFDRNSIILILLAGGAPAESMTRMLTLGAMEAVQIIQKVTDEEDAQADPQTD